MLPINKIKSLYDQCLCVVHDLIIFPKLIATMQLEESTNFEEHTQCDMINSKLTELNRFLLSTIPLMIIDEIIVYHEKSIEADKTIVRSSIRCNSDNNIALTKLRLCFYKATRHKQMEYFKIKNLQFPIYEWKYLFNTISMANVIYLNLSLSCTDEILELIPKYFHHVEYLNATCKYARLSREFAKENAMSFSVTVTDRGLKYLHSCRRLRSIITNVPRSHGRGVSYTITHEGLRQLIRNVPTIENINYSDSGAVISYEMADLEKINLRIIRHFNPTTETIQEILRLCWKLNELYFIFFEYKDRPEILDILLHSERLKQLKAIGLEKLNLRPEFRNFFSKIGQNLVHLQFMNNAEPIIFEELIAIADYCPNLEEFFARFCNEKDVKQYDKQQTLTSTNPQHFQYLEKLIICGHHINFETIVPFCVENTKNLLLLNLSDSAIDRNMDNLFCKLINPVYIQYIEMEEKLDLSRMAILNIISQFKCLKSLKVYCEENCDDIDSMVNSTKRKYDFKFINKRIKDLTGMYHPYQQLYN